MKLSFHARFGIGLAALAGFAFIIYHTALITLTICGGFILFSMVEQVIDALKQRGLRGWQVPCILVLLLAIVHVAVVLFLGLPMIEQIENLGTQIPALAAQLGAKTQMLSDSMPFIEPLIEKGKSALIDALQTMFSNPGGILTSLVTIPLIAVTLFFTKTEIEEAFYALIPNDYFEVTVSIGNSIIRHIRDYVSAKGIETLAMIAIYAIGFQVIGLPQGLLLAILAGLLNIVPYLGPLLTIIPVGFVALVAGSGQLFGLSLVVLLVARLIDDAVLQTYLVAKYVDVHPLIVVIATLAFGEILGPIGLIIAIPLFVISKILVVGLYEALSAVDRHERLLQYEESENQHDTHA